MMSLKLFHLFSLFIFCLSITTVKAQSVVSVRDGDHNLTYVGYASQGVENFQGIRYGQDTSGSNRFKHPKAFAYPKGTTVQATAAGASCPQSTLMTFLGAVSENPGVYDLSEDCLTLRIARPAGTSQTPRTDPLLLPVMVWLYGGGDESGSTNYSLYDPTALVVGAQAKGTPVIFAAMNYRVNVFGFANSAALRREKSLNSGLLDQRLAIEWIRENIAAFGGDPGNVIIFGESDGGTGVGLQMTAYGGNGTVPFHRAIMQSGSPAADAGVSGNFTVTSTSTVAELAGCSGENSTATLPCLRGLPMTTLLAAVLQYENMTASEGISQDIFFPAVDGDFIPAAPSTLVRTGKFHHNVSVIVGWNYNDGSIFVPPTLGEAPAVQAFVRLSYPHLNASTVETLVGLYPVDSFVASAATLEISPYFLQAAQIYRDVNFACPALDVAHHVGLNSFLYELNASSFASLLTLVNASFEGVIHLSDVPFVFNQPNLGLGVTAAENVTAARMSGSWAHFATTGDPSGSPDQTLAGWTHAFNKTELASMKNQTVSRASVRVIGGPSAGQHEFLMSGGALEPDLLKRCEFINSVEFYRQLQT